MYSNMKCKKNYFVFFVLLILYTSSVYSSPSRPLIFIPGILGSKLYDGDKLVWGGRSSYNNIDQLYLPKNQKNITLQPKGIIDSIKILGPFKIRQYNDLLKHFSKLGYKKDKTLFIFAYDWRQSNYINAEKLRLFIANNTLLANKPVDIVAHSMGGLVARIMIQSSSANQPKVKNFITLGTPHRGATDIIKLYWEGMGGVENFLAGGDKVVRNVLFSFQSTYEMLPASPSCCYQGSRNDVSSQQFNIFDEHSLFWKKWLPSRYKNNKGNPNQFVSKSLTTAKKLKELLEQDIPKSIEFYPFAGDTIDTLYRVYVDKNSFNPNEWLEGLGDGTVPVKSAANDKIAKARVSFSQHATIFDDSHVKIALKRILMEDQGPVDFAGHSSEKFVTTSDGEIDIPIDSIKVEFEKKFIEVEKENVIRVKINPINEDVKDVAVKICIFEDGANLCKPINNMKIIKEGEIGIYQWTYTPKTESTFIARVLIDGLGTYEDYFVSMKKNQ